MYYSYDYFSPVGILKIVCDEEAITGLWIEGQKHFAAGLTEAHQNKSVPVLEQAVDWLDKYFAGEKPNTNEIPLFPCGSEFQRMIWDMLCEIPYGEVVTYGDLAKKAAQKTGKTKMSAQAIGGAVGHNKISIIIPCHRVVGSGKKLTGYDGGIDKKIKLLTHEGVDLTEYR